MAQTLTRVLVHIIFSTKDRRDLITPATEPELHAYLGGISRDQQSPAIEIGGTENHVHLVVSLSKNIALADFLMNLKKESSKWIKTKGDLFADFHWQDGYAGFSVSESQLEAVRQYIRMQKEHHRKMTFEEELTALAERHNVPYDPRYLWT